MHRSNFLAALLVLAGVLVAQHMEALRNEAGTQGERSRTAGLIAPLPSNADLPVAQTVTLAATAYRLANTDAPARDLISLTQRLKLKSSEPIPLIVNPTAPDYRVGDAHIFNIADIADSSYYSATATIRVVTPHAYWYVQDDYDIDQAALERAANYFESDVYPKNRRVFGSEAQPGVDNDPRITVLLAPIPGVGGYFSNADSYPLVVNPLSNQRDMLYLATVPKGDPADPDNYFMGTLAHEYQHMIHWNVHRSREVWLDEGSAEIAMYINGYNPGGSDVSFTLSPDTQLNAWSNLADASAHYGASYLFLRYAMDRFGGEDFMGRLMQTERLGTAALDEALAASGQSGGFDAAFKDWTIANILNDETLAGGRYSYSEGGRVTAGTTIRSYPATTSDTVRQYGADYIRLAGATDGATVTFKGSSAAPVIAAGPRSGASFWYSNRRDSGDATLTREVNLTTVDRATLNFWAWYDIESMFDYAYIEASTDEGATWTTLQGKYTTTDNPNGISYGHGWTGASGTADGAGEPAWIEESVDLTQFAGKRILLRFEYITDEGYNKPGMAIDDLSIPEIGWLDNAESPNDWSSAGWLRIGNRVPQRWFVALIERGNGGVNRVRQMPVSVSGAGRLEIEGIGMGTGTRDAILVIAPLAPKTTELASYTVTVENR